MWTRTEDALTEEFLPIDRNENKDTLTTVFQSIYGLVCSKIDVWKSRKHGRECCHCVSGSLYQWRHEQGGHEWQKYQVRHEPTFFCFSHVKSEPIWSLKLKLKKSTSVAWISMKQPHEAWKWKYWHILNVFMPLCVFRFMSSLNPHQSFTYPLTARVVGASQMISLPVSSIFLCSPLPSWTWRTPGLFIPRCCLPTSSSVCLVLCRCAFFVYLFVCLLCVCVLCF